MNSALFGRETLILDGAMGTQLIERGLQRGEPSILWNITHPTSVRSVHRSYADVGCHCLTTNSFGGSPIMLAKYDLGDRVDILNQSAIRLAREAGEGRCKILGDVGPCGEFLDPLGDLTEEELIESIKRQASPMVEAGIDAFIVETMSDPNELAVTVAALVPFGLPVLASFTFERTTTGCQTIMGTSPEEAALAAISAGAVAVGANCGTSMSLDDYLDLAYRLIPAAGDKPVLLQPNAGTPTTTAVGFAYDMAPKEFASWGVEAAKRGVSIIGGCCGTSPALLAELVRSLEPSETVA